MSDLQQRVDNAYDRFETESAKLLREDGTRRFADRGHAERSAAPKAELGSALDTVETSADQEIALAETTLATHADRSALLSTQELEAANGRCAFVSEDADSLPLDELATHAEAVASSGDKASMFLFARYCRTRAER